MSAGALVFGFSGELGVDEPVPAASVDDGVVAGSAFFGPPSPSGFEFLA